MSNETIFSEVDEELRRDRLRSAWRRFGPYIIGAAIAVVLAVAINEGWAWWQNSTAARSSDQFYAALELAEKGDIAGAQTALAAVEAQGSGSYPVLARFREASLLAKEGKTDDALAAYDGLANSDINPRLRELALIMAANVLVDRGDVAGVQQRVSGLATPDNPLHNVAQEAIGLAQYKAGDANAALQTFETISADPQVNRTQQSRMQVYINQLVSQGAVTPEQAAAATSPQATVEPGTPTTAPETAPTEVPGNAPQEAPAQTPPETTPAPPQEAPVEAPTETPVTTPAEAPATPAPTEIPATPATPAAPAN